MSTDASSSCRKRRTANHGLLGGAMHWVADLGEVVIGWVIALGDIALFSARTIRWMLTRAAAERYAAAEFLPDWRAQLAGGGAHRHVHRHGAGRAKLRSIPANAVGNAVGRDHQYVAGARTGTGAGGHDAGRPRRQRHGRRVGHDARDRTNRRACFRWAQTRFIIWSCRGFSAACC